jgi:DNA-binding Lrp family transcriptional regulator
MSDGQRPRGDAPRRRRPVERRRRVGLSPSACLRRVQAPERRGFIAGDRAQLPKRRLGLVASVAVRRARHSRAAEAAFERAMRAAREAAACHTVTGAIDYRFRVGAVDPASCKRFHTAVPGTQAGVVAIATHVITGSPGDERA